MTLLTFFIFANLALLIPAYSYINILFPLFKKKELILPLAYAVNIAFYALLSLIFYTLQAPSIVIQFLFWTYFFIGTCFFVVNKYYKNLKDDRFVLASILLMVLLSLSFIGLSFTGEKKFIPDPEPLPARNYDAYNVKVLNVSQTWANDNSIPYRQAQFIVNRSDPAKDSFIEEWGVHFFQRTPLMGSVSGAMFIALDDKLPINYIWSSYSSDSYKTYEKFQILAHILNSIVLIPAFLLIKKFFDRKTAKVTTLFIVTSQFFLYNSFFTWPKTFVAFFIILSYLFVAENKHSYTVIAGIVGGFAYLTHDLAVLYIGTILLLLLFAKRYKDIFIYGFLWLVFALPWLLVSGLKYKKPSTFPLYPLSINGIPQISERKQIIDEFLNTPIWTLVKIRLESLYYLLTPYQLIYSEGAQEASRRAWALGLFSIPGSLGFGLIIPTILGFFTKSRKLDFYLLIFVPIILSAILIGWPRGLGSFHFAQTSVILLMALGSAWLLKVGSRLIAFGAILINLAQLVFFMTYSFDTSYKNWINVPDICAIVVISTIFIGTSSYILSLCKSKTISPARRRHS
jgi:hypothetical protein